MPQDHYLIERAVDLRDHNTLALAARADSFCRLHSTAAAQRLARAEKSARRRFILGAGSNCVLAEQIDALVLMPAMRGRALAGEDAAAVYVTAGAGESWHDFVVWTLQQGLPGLENLLLIPGTVGAAPVQNIGAYGVELAERFAWLEAVDMTDGSLRRFTLADCAFAYRHSVFKAEGWHLDGRYLISRVCLRLAKQWEPQLAYGEIAAELAAAGVDQPTPGAVAAAVSAIRRRKLPDPARLPNAGSFFQNPLLDAAKAAALAQRYPDLPRYPQANGRVKVAAGWLIEAAGWKGRRLGPVGMYEKQALVLVNHASACASDVRALAQAVIADVAARFGVVLEPEPVCWPEW